MVVRTNARQEEQAKEQGEELVLVALTYTGERSLFSSQGMRNQGNYPSLDGFQGPGPGDEVGETKLVVLPSSSLGWWESHGAFDVAYDSQTIARALLEANYFPESLVGPGYDPDERERLCDVLGIQPQSTEDEWREALLGVADYAPDEEPEEDDSGHSPRVERLVGNTDRSVLVKVAGSFDGIGEYAEDLGKTSYGHLGQYELASFLERHEDDAVDRRIEKAEMGGDL